jgi:hypothetical protein
LACAARLAFFRCAIGSGNKEKIMLTKPLYLRQLAAALGVLVALSLSLIPSPANASTSSGDDDKIKLVICKIVKVEKEKFNKDETFKFVVKDKQGDEKARVDIKIKKADLFTKVCKEVFVEKGWYTVKEVAIPYGYKLDDINVEQGQYQDKNKDDCRVDVHAKNKDEVIIIVFINIIIVK